MRNAECGVRNGWTVFEPPPTNRQAVLPLRTPHSAFRTYSYLSAMIGSRLAARRAGQMPKNSPTAALNTKDRKSTRLNSSHGYISYAVFCLKKKKKQH